MYYGLLWARGARGAWGVGGVGRNANVNLIIFKCAGQEENRRTKLVG